MIVRIVKMTFQPEKVGDFLKVFNASKQYILAMEGCLSVELLNDISATHVFFTYSRWRSEDDLNNYRNSELFANVWGKTKVLFEKKAEAWSLKPQG